MAAVAAVVTIVMVAIGFRLAYLMVRGWRRDRGGREAVKAAEYKFHVRRTPGSMYKYRAYVERLTPPPPRYPSRYGGQEFKWDKGCSTLWGAKLWAKLRVRKDRKLMKESSKESVVQESTL